jgi:ankyrin repeat protein
MEGSAGVTEELCQAVKNGDLAEVTRLLKLGVNPNCVSSDWYKTRPIILAATGGHLDIIKLLLDQPTLDPNCCDELFGNTALIDASHAGNTDVVRILVEDERVELNYRTKGSGITALMQAARYGHTSVVEVLVEKEKAGVNIQSGGGCTPLMLGCMAPNQAVLNDPQMFRAMLAVKELDLSIKDGQGKTALDWARDKELFMVEK